MLSVSLVCGFTMVLYLLQGLSDTDFRKIMKNEKETNSFIIVLDDLSMIEATLVSIYSLKVALLQQPVVKNDILLMIPDSLNIKNSDLGLFEKLGVYITKTHWEHPSNSELYYSLSKLLKLSIYDKMIYFTHDILFDNDVGQLFDQLPNSVVMSTRPALLLLSQDGSMRDKASPLNEMFHNVTDALLENKHFHLFSGPMKPWMMHSYKSADWVRQLDPVSFYKWRRLGNDLNRFLGLGGLWKNRPRQNAVCDDYLNTKEFVEFPLKHRFSVLLSTYNPERIRHLSDNISHLLKSSSIEKIYVTWHNPSLKVPSSLYESIPPQDRSRLKILKQSYDSLNNRFNPISDLNTEAVYIMDDDIFMDLEDLELAFNTWRSNVNSIVGHFPRIHTYDPSTRQATYRVSNRAPYSIILTKSMFVRSEYLFAYTCVLEPELHAYVDREVNCEDLGFAMMASGLSQATPILVNTRQPIEDFGLKKGISTHRNHMPARSQCISQFISKFWKGDDPLVLSNETAMDPPKIRKGNWNRVRQSMLKECTLNYQENKRVCS
ncbi:glycosyl transferase family 64 domain-containing protein [Sporodiniella umbellata]|nr:glycosyl transferase family 64 domain-containing protein [Sporodiniella umbellata]